MGKIPRRKSLTRRKKGRYQKKGMLDEEVDKNFLTADHHEETPDLQNFALENDPGCEEGNDNFLTADGDHHGETPDFKKVALDYDSGTVSPSNFSSDTTNFPPDQQQCPAVSSEPSEDLSEVTCHVSEEELVFEVQKKLQLFLRKSWMCIPAQDKIHVVKVSLQKSACIQRSVVLHPEGNVELFVHNKPVNCNTFTVKANPPLALRGNTINDFVDRAASIVNNIDQMAVCAGYDDTYFETAWATCPFGEVDKNIFSECRYIETFRAHNCSMLVPFKKWRCENCQKLYAPLRRRKIALAAEERHPNTGNVFLTEEQRLKKLQDLRTEADNLKKKKYRIQQRMEEVIKKEGVKIPSELSDDFSEILGDISVSPAQSIFLQQQIKASQQKKACGMRWHPTMIRFALALHLTSPSAYELVRQTGMIKLPSSMTLFDYSHAKAVEEGVDKVVLESLEACVKKFPEKHKKYHVLMMDEMYISQNLVFQKSNGKLVGYTSLDTIEREVKNLEELIDATEALESEDTIASKVLVYMIKGVSNGVKQVVATYAVSKLSSNQLKDWTWHVIGDLEKHGIAIIAVVCDGSAVNRSFFKKHRPATQHVSGIVFDTLNRAARDRKLYFISDVPHLLKTIRNCLLNSRWDNKKSRRKMVKNGKKISWDFIVRLYDEKMKKTLRKSYKLNAQNVYPDSYARMKVKLAGQVLSNTVQKDMQSQGWYDATETVSFIDRVNQWFDCLNGAHSSQGQKSGNKNLKPYQSKEDPRFDLLEDFLKYLDEWQREVDSSADQSINASRCSVDNSVVADSPDCDVSEIENAVFNPETDTPASKKVLSRETLEGIRITTLAFKPLVHFLLDEGVSFINARIFSQDPLEQYFSKVRAGQGGSTNPNLGQVLNRMRALFTIGELGIRKRKGNSGQEAHVVQVTDDPLPKRKCVRVPKLSKTRD